MESSAMISGVGMTSFGRFNERSVRSLTSEAVREALSDATLAPADVGMVFFANAAGGILHAQEMIAGQSALRGEGFDGIPVFNVENACASASSAVSMATMAVISGACDVALAVGAEKLTHGDRRRSVTALATACDLEDDPKARVDLSRTLLGWDLELDQAVAPAAPVHQGSVFMEIYAHETREYMKATGATVQDLAVIAAKNHSNGALNDRAQFRKLVSPEDVLQSRSIFDPLTLLMCSPIGDGAAAVVVTSADYASRLARPAVRVRAVSVASGLSVDADSKVNTVERASANAFERASVSPEDIDVVELHDAAAPGELFAYEEIGLCPKGEGPKHLASGATQIGGRQPVNPSGGLLARGHPIGATGCAQLVELVQQLRGESGQRQVHQARMALAHNSGGNFGDGQPASCVVTILEGP